MAQSNGPAATAQDEPLPVLHVPARDIPIPTTLSPQARAMLAEQILAKQSGAAMQMPAPPALDDIEGWRANIAMVDKMLMERQLATAPKVAADVREIDAGGARVFDITPAGVAPDDRAVYLDIHGGAFIYGGGEACRAYGVGNAGYVGARVWAVDYRMPPDHPFPAGLDDCMAAYRTLLNDHRPEDIVVGGGSAGGNLAAALMLRAGDEGLPLPAAVLLLTPALDLTRAGDTFRTNLDIDTVLGGGNGESPGSKLYTADHDRAHPYLSPLFGDVAKGFPPTFLMSGTRDLLLSCTVCMHRKLRQADIPAELHIFEAAPHGGFIGAPEGDDLYREVRRFAQEHWNRA